jgi:hypothetical protein
MTCAVLLAGCAGMGGGLVAGKSTAQDVAAAMGKPALELKGPGGETVQYFTFYPWGRSVKAATIGPDGVLRSFEERLTKENVSSIREGMREEEVRARLGPPRQITPNALKQTIVWEYPWIEAAKEFRISWISFSADGVVRGVVEAHDEEAQPRSD